MKHEDCAAFMFVLFWGTFLFGAISFLTGLR